MAGFDGTYDVLDDRVSWVTAFADLNTGRGRGWVFFVLRQSSRGQATT